MNNLPETAIDEFNSRTSELVANGVNGTADLTTVDFAVLGIATLIVILLLRQRTNVALAIFGLCVGFFFQTLLAGELLDSLDDQNFDARHLVNAGLVFTPALLIIWRFKDFQHGRSMLHIIPGFAFVALATMLALRIMPGEFANSLQEQSQIIDWIAGNNFWVALVTVSLALLDVVVFESQRDRRQNRIKKQQSRLSRRKR